MQAMLKESANYGDTVLSLNELLDKVAKRFPERRAYPPDRAVVIAEADFYREVLWMALVSLCNKVVHVSVWYSHIKR